MNFSVFIWSYCSRMYSLHYAFCNPNSTSFPQAASCNSQYNKTEDDMCDNHDKSVSCWLHGPSAQLAFFSSSCYLTKHVTDGKMDKVVQRAEEWESMMHNSTLPSFFKKVPACSLQAYQFFLKKYIYSSRNFTPQIIKLMQSITFMCISEFDQVPSSSLLHDKEKIHSHGLLMPTCFVLSVSFVQCVSSENFFLY